MHQPPKWASNLLNWICPPQLAEGILGDLVEQFELNCEQKGRTRATIIFIWTTLRFIHPEIIFRNKRNTELIKMGLYKNHLLVAWRSMLRYRFYSLINILGLSSAMAFALITFLFIQGQLSYDQFHKEKDLIYRAISYTRSEEGHIMGDKSGVTPIPLGEVLQEDVPGVEAYTRFGTGSGTVLMNNTPYTETIAFADPNFLTIFNYPVLQGDRFTALSDPSAIMISPDTKAKYFDQTDPIGKSIDLILNDSIKTFVVTGIIEDLEGASSLEFDFLIPFERMEIVSAGAMTSFRVAFTELYLKFGAIPDENIADVLTEAVGRETRPDGSYWVIDVQPISDMHLDPEVQGLASYTDPQRLWVMAALGLLVLIVACINFITLSTGHSMNRIKEIGLRKTLGAFRRMLTVQLIFESIFIAGLAGALGLGLCYILVPLFNDFLDSTITFNFSLDYLLFFILMVILIGLTAGIIQSLLLVKFQPVVALKGVKLFSSKESYLNQVLIIVQFTLGIMLVIGTLAIRSQMQFIQNQDLGFEKEKLIEIDLFSPDDPETANQLVDLFKSRISTHPQVLGATATMNNFRDPWTELSFRQTDDSEQFLFYNQVDPGFVETMGIEIIEGEDFHPDGANSGKAILVNEALVRHFEWKDPLNQQIPGKNFDETHQIVGVMKDFHFSSLHNKIEPLILALDVSAIGSGITGLNTYVWPSLLNRMIVRIGPGELNNVMSFLESVSREINPQKPFTYHFVDDQINYSYEEEQRWNKVMNASSVFSLLIAWMGLLGLTRLSVQKRLKEIGIRRVLGSNVREVTLLLSKRFLILVVIAMMIAIPVSWVLLERWLESFEYRITPSILMFIGASVLVLVIAMVSVGTQALKAAVTNPAESLKYE